MDKPTIYLAIGMAIPTVILGYRAFAAYRNGKPWKPLAGALALAIGVIALTYSGLDLFLRRH
jgi:hypothetical protein